jgi:hypothetical protein
MESIIQQFLPLIQQQLESFLPIIQSFVPQLNTILPQLATLLGKRQDLEALLQSVIPDIINTLDEINAVLAQIGPFVPLLTLLTPGINLPDLLNTLTAQLNLLVNTGTADIPLLLSLLPQVQQVIPIVQVFVPSIASLNLDQIFAVITSAVGKRQLAEFALDFETIALILSQLNIPIQSLFLSINPSRI